MKDKARGYVEVVEAHCSGRPAKCSEGHIFNYHLAKALWLEKGEDSFASHIACIATCYTCLQLAVHIQSTFIASY